MNAIDNPLLLVDPYKNLLHAYQILFDQVGLPVETACSLEDARCCLVGQKYSVVLSELLLPEADGLTFWQEIKSRHPDLYLILLTDALLDEDRYEKVFNAGADDLIVKPFSPEKLLIHVRRGLRQRALIQFRQRQECLALMDSLSPSLDRIILNGVYFRQCLRRELKRARRHQEPLSLLRLTAKGSRAAEDGLDFFLAELAGLIRKSIREEDFMGREKDGFGLLLVKTDQTGARVLRDRLAKLVQSHPLFREPPFRPLSSSLKFQQFSYTNEQDPDLPQVINN